MTITMVLDCDPGHDDAFAILTAARYANLVGITTVNGNVGIDLTTRNALIVTQIAGLDVPVHVGAARPLVEAPRHAEHVHGASGLDGPTLPALDRAPAGFDAVGFLLDLSHRIDELWVVATGPLTNIALALRRDPSFLDRIAGVAVMGGGVGVGNVTAAAEFNVWADPEASAIVYDSGAHPIMVGLNLTHQVRMGPAEIEELIDAATPTSRFCADLLGFYHERAHGEKAPIHDPCAVLAVTHPRLFGTVPRAVHVELTGTITRGMTVIDERPDTAEPPNAEVAYTVDATAVRALVLDAAIGV